jgi:hypothetical protein
VGKWSDILLCRPPAPPPAPPPPQSPEVLAFELMLRLFVERPDTWTAYQGAKLVTMNGYASNKYAMLEHAGAGVIIQYAWDHAPTSPGAFHIQVGGEQLKIPAFGEGRVIAAIKDREAALQRKLEQDRAAKQLKQLVEATENLL